MTHDEFVTRLSIMPLSTENLFSTWNPPEWEQIVEWWDQYINEARALSERSYRDLSPTE